MCKKEGVNLVQGIYQITNKINNKIYLGSSNNITYRWEQHIHDLLNNEHHNIDLQNDFELQGRNINQFTFKILEICKDDIIREDLYKLEGKYIYKLQSYKIDIGYNKIINNFKGYVKDKNNNKNASLEDESMNVLLNYCDAIRIDYLNNIKNNITIKTITDLTKFKNEKHDFIFDNGFLCKNWFINNKDKHYIIKNLLVNYFMNYNKNNSKLWTTYLKFKDSLKGKGYIKNFKVLNNSNIINADNYVFIANIFLDTQTDLAQTKENNDRYALSFLLKWITNNINLNHKCELFIPSLRMYNLLNDYLKEFKGADENV